MVLTNPPFGRKSSMTFVSEEGDVAREDLVVVRDDFWASTSNKQLNFVQHVKTLLAINGRAAVVVPDNVLFEGGAGETVRRSLEECDVHTLLRCRPVLLRARREGERPFFDRKPAAEAPLDARAVGVRPADEHALHAQAESARPRASRGLRSRIAAREESERFRPFTYDELMQRDKVSLDITWLRDVLARGHGDTSRRRT